MKRSFLFFLLTSFFMLSRAEIKDFIPAEYYRGTISTLPVRILIATNESEVHGFLFYEKIGEPIWVTGEMRGDSLLLTEYPDPVSPESVSPSGFMKLKRKGSLLEGEWKNPVSGKTFPLKCTLNKEKVLDTERLITLSPVRKLSIMELITIMSCRLTGPVREALYIPEHWDRWVENPEVPASLAQPQQVGINLDTADLTSAEGEEILLRLGLLNNRAMYFVLQRSDSGWMGLPQYLDEGVEYDMAQCNDNENMAAVNHRLVEACNGEIILDLKVEQNYCGPGTMRGGHADRKLYRIYDTAIMEIIWLVESEYWSSAPCGHPSGLPVQVSIEYVRTEDYKLQLKCSHSIYRMEAYQDPDSGCEGMREVDLGTAIQLVDLCD